MPKPSSKYTSIIRAFEAVPLDDMPLLLVDLTNRFDLARIKRTRILSEELLRLTRGKKQIAPARKYIGKAQKQERTKPAAKYRSKKDKSLTWSGRGSTPRWMREEMKAGKLKREAFLITR